MPTLLLRRGTTSERLNYTPLNGEIILDSDLNQCFIGDGIVPGGAAVIMISDGPVNSVQFSDAVTNEQGALRGSDKFLFDGNDITITADIMDIDTPNITIKSESLDIDTLYSITPRIVEVGDLEEITLLSTMSEITTLDSAVSDDVNVILEKSINLGTIHIIHYSQAGTKNAGGPPFTATINDILVNFTTITSGAAFVDAADIVFDINAVGIPDLLASLSGNNIVLTGPIGSTITIVNGMNDAAGNPFAGPGSITGLPLEAISPSIAESTPLSPISRRLIIELKDTPLSTEIMLEGQTKMFIFANDSWRLV